MNPNENQSNSQTNTQAPAQPQQTSGAQESHKLMAALSYIGILVLIPLLAGKDNSFVKFHARQGLVLFAIEILSWFIGMTFYPLWMVLRIVNLAVFVLSIVGIINVVKGAEKPLPLVGGLASHFKI